MKPKPNDPASAMSMRHHFALEIAKGLLYQKTGIDQMLYEAREPSDMRRLVRDAIIIADDMLAKLDEDQG